MWVTTFKARSPSWVSRGEFGPLVGVPRLLDLLRRHGVPATFFIPGMTAEQYPDAVRAIRDAGHELATHGDIHEGHVNLSPAEERAVLERGIDKLVAVSGITPAGFRAPHWELSEATISIIEELGLRYDSSQFASDYTPYRCRRGDSIGLGVWEPGEPSAVWEIPIAWELDDVPFFLIHPPHFFGTTTPAQALEVWTGELDFMIDDVHNGVFTVAFHPQVIGRGPRIHALQRLIQHGKDRGAAFATVTQVVNSLDAHPAGDERKGSSFEGSNP